MLLYVCFDTCILPLSPVLKWCGFCSAHLIFQCPSIPNISRNKQNSMQAGANIKDIEILHNAKKYGFLHHICHWCSSQVWMAETHCDMCIAMLLYKTTQSSMRLIYSSWECFVPLPFIPNMKNRLNLNIQFISSWTLEMGGLKQMYKHSNMKL